MNDRLTIKNSFRGFTTMELVVSIGIFSLISAASAWLIINSFRSNAVIWEQLATQSEGRKVLKQIVDEARTAEASSIGSYPIELADDYDFIFFANIDDDSLRERVRYWLDGVTLKKEVIKPSGTPMAYDLGNKSTIELAHNVINQSKDSALFQYFDENYTGAEDPLITPADVSKVRAVRVRFELEKDPSSSPAPLNIESTVSIRNLKGN